MMYLYRFIKIVFFPLIAIITIFIDMAWCFIHYIKTGELMDTDNGLFDRIYR